MCVLVCFVWGELFGSRVLMGCGLLMIRFGGFCIGVLGFVIWFSVVWVLLLVGWVACYFRLR